MSYLMTEESPVLYMGNLLQIMHDHGQEVYGPGVNVNLFRFAGMIQADLAKVFVLQYDNQPVGYSFWFTGQDLMFAHIKRADEVALYVKPEHRGRPAYRFMLFTEIMLKEKGFQRIVRSAQLNSSLHKLLKHMKYSDAEVFMAKDL